MAGYRTLITRTTLRLGFGLPRQYFPRATTDFRAYTQDDLDEVTRGLNG